MASFMIGSFQFTSTNQQRYQATALSAPSLISAYDTSVSNAFAELDKLASKCKNCYLGGTIERIKGTRFYSIRKPTEIQRQKAIESRDKMATAKQWLENWSAEDSLIESIAHKFEVPGTQQGDDPIRTNTRALSVSKQKRSRPAVLVVQGNAGNLIRAVSNITRKRNITIEVIGKRGVKSEHITLGNGRYLKVLTKHEKGIKHKRDVVIGSWERQVITALVRKTSGRLIHKASDFSRGSSGIALLDSMLQGNKSNARGGLFVIRGRDGHKLYDSQNVITASTMHSLTHYSVSERFWKGYNTSFLNHRPQTSHTCESNLDVEECGIVAALATQALFPCGKITCIQCSNNFVSSSKAELREAHSNTLNSLMEEIRTKHPKFMHVVKFLSLFNDFLQFDNANIDQFSEIKRLIGERSEAPFTQLNKLNNLLIKVGESTAGELASGTATLLELTRFQRNRTDNIASGSLTHFRNKVSSKVHVNLDLMCDNQLDDDGNFKWRRRSYHAKRLISNFFEVIEPERGYDAYVVRRNPNGMRKTAIGNLIVSTNLQTFRQQMRGEPIEAIGLTTACVSKLKGGFVYPCCCVTSDEGVPIESGMLIPTKNHLVIGNTGDSKFVVMPSVMEENMYVAKPGYCYINIFIAMLINVSDVQAKDYTKKVRDYAIPKLGEWPTLIDVATMCHFLTVFFPDTQSAELPRILVDHKSKTMHVIDSFGSLTTGYHILKANTIGQLVKFANDDLQSEMMHYRVGGFVDYSDESSEDAAITVLARGIYRPKELASILEKDPLLLVYGLLSPSVLVAMYSSKTLERALSLWLHKDIGVANLCHSMEILACKVSVSKALAVQQTIIATHASELAHCINRSTAVSPSRQFVRLILNRLIEEQASSKDLVSSGFSTLSLEGDLMREKKFLEVLAHSWRDLSWSERCTSIWHSRKLSTKSTESRTKEDERGSKETWRERLSFLRGNITQKVKTFSRTSTVSAKRLAYETCGRIVCKFATSTRFFFPDLCKFVNILSVVYILLQVAGFVNAHLQQVRQLREDKQRMEDDEKFDQMMQIYTLFNVNRKEVDKDDTEFRAYLQKYNPPLSEYFVQLMGDGKQESAEFQAKGSGEVELERTIAFVALIMMMFDAERSDCVYKVLNKLRGLMNPLSVESAAFQGLDDIQSVFGEARMAIDIELDTENFQLNGLSGMTFGKWWGNQINQGRTMPHYRTEGHFVEFTRANAIIVANDIAHMSHRDILVMGAVGSGKSTGLPYHLSKKGKVLVVEPTRPLAENVHRQLKGEPFLTQATLRIRGCSVFGSAPITVMTSGYALHYYAHNISQLEEYEFVMFDECHVHDAAAMAFRCLLAEYNFGGKVLKVSATPPGREAIYSTQHPVKVKMEESLTFQQFVQMQGTGANGDVIQHGDNILVYVSSYNEVDTLSRMLIEHNHKVTKVDGRTMKMGQVEIPTSGTAEKRHFIVATNIIENGVTLDIDVVVDFGLKVIPELDADNRLVRYTKVPISYGERIQRLGRVGRHKEGTALRIGVTEKGLSAVPNVVATEAAFFSFAYGLPVMTSGVEIGMLSQCTVAQARTIMHFELPIFYMLHLVRFDGTMHPAIHEATKNFKLRDSEILLNKLAIPNCGVKSWMTAGEYTRVGAKNSIDEFVRIPFYSKDIPDATHVKIWEAVVQHKRDAGFGRIQSASACKVAYTLQTDAASITRTVCIIEELIKNEIKKQEYFRAAAGVDCSSGFSLVSLTNAIRSRHMSNHTAENIAILEAAKNQLYEFRNLGIEPTSRTVCDFGALECVQFQSKEGVSKQLGLKGHWNKSLLTNDIMVAGFTLFGGLWMIYNKLRQAVTTSVTFQGSGKRQSQKARFQLARNNKHAYEVNPDATDVEYYFGEAYGKKAQGKGRTRGMGTKSRRFYNMYGFDPSEYSFARYVDPLTGYTLDENSLTDIKLVQEHFGKIRLDLLSKDQLESQALNKYTTIEAYFVKDLAKQVLKIDMEPHRCLEVGRNTESIAGYPERQGELRQVDRPQMVNADLMPKANEYKEEGVDFESKATFQGLRDYNSISTSICLLENDSDGYTMKIHGIGFGSIVITNQHLFKRNNGSLKVTSHRGTFLIPNTTQLKMFPFEGRDLMLIQMPKDFPPFPQKLKFRTPVSGERVCLVGSNFQDKYISSTISEASVIAQKDNSHFYRHWISTKKGHCGLPLVSVKDGYILGIHSLTSLEDASSFFIAPPDNIVERFLQNDEEVEWTKRWRLNLDLINWGSLKITEEKPDNLFRLSKDIFGLLDETVDFQAQENGWLYGQLTGNLTAVARTQNQLVTKHVVKGKCMLFATYLETHKEAQEYFKPRMGAYQKSKLNREAYIKDLFKYNKSTIVGVLDPRKFERAEFLVFDMFKRVGFTECEYVTHTESIFSALNMKAAVGALYQGKKKEYFADFSDADKNQILKDSCYRLYTGKLGVWNGSLKAELRPLEKVLANKTRSFTAAPIDTLLGGKVCVDDFNNQFYSLNLQAPWSVGMTKFYGGWDKLMRLLPDGWIYCDADGSQFDSSLTPYLINSVLNLRLRFMEKWDIGEVMLSNLYTEIIYTPIATPDGTIIKKFKGNNSGQPSTVVDNTIMVILAMYYASEVYNSDLILEEYCKFFVNGDDLLIAVHPDHQKFLDGLQESFNHLGLIYNFDSRWRKREDLWFMSHKAVDIGGMYIPKLEEERIVSILEWDRAVLPEHRLEALCASMIEAWGYPELLHQIRKFYYWVLKQAPYNTLSAEGKAPYISEVALKHLYTNNSEPSELQKYIDSFDYTISQGSEMVEFQAGEELNAGAGGLKDPSKVAAPGKELSSATAKDKDVDAGTSGTFQVPRLKAIGTKFSLPKVKGRTIVNLDHLLTYEPDQLDLSNVRATHAQFGTWYEGVKEAYGLDDNAMGIVLNGLMVWCIENGTSPNINGHWTMMDGENQIEYPLRPVLENAQPTLRQIMAHFSALAEAYIEKRNATKPYMPRYGLLRNLRDMSLARFAFDFYEVTSRTPARAREAHMQMKAAAIRNSDTRMFGLDGNTGDKEENTERHTTNDVNREMHNLMGVRL